MNHLIAFFAFSLWAPPALAQVTLNETIVYPPVWSNSSFGASAAIGDVDGDGQFDLAVGYPLMDAGRGGAYVFFGPDFASSMKVTHPTFKAAGANYAGDWWGYIRVDDVNEDGFGDVYIAAAQALPLTGSPPKAGRARVFFGPDLANSIELAPPIPSMAFQGFGGPADFGDVTGDGVRDIVVGSTLYWSHGSSGRISVFDGATGFVGPAIEMSPPPGVYYGGAWGDALLVEDFDGDGGDDVLVVQAVLQPMQSAEAFIKHGLDQGLGYFPWPFSGANLDIPSRRAQFVDVNGDGVKDLLTHMPSTFPIGQAGRLVIQHGPTYLTSQVVKGSLENSYDGFAHSFDIGDVDRDGHVDIACGQPGLDVPGTPGGDHWAGRMTIFFGPTFAQSMEFNGSYHQVQMGTRVLIADTDADGFGEVFATEEEWGPGRVHVYRHHTLRLTGPTEASVTTGTTLPMSIEVGKLSANAPYLMLMSASGSTPGLTVPYAGGSIHVPLQFDALTSAGLSLVNSPLCANFMSTLDANGTATATLSIPGGVISPVFAGLSITCAAVVGDPQGNIAYATRSVAIPLVP
ncbi:MAG: FG-GAP repeat protein [Planctomycetes bacterium]|nr:FG-GAP repeat protein [Planctomycetota bacterium]